jgi:hypothetical protein
MDQQQREADEHLAQPRLGDIAQHRTHQHPAGEDQGDDEADRLCRVAPVQRAGIAFEQAEEQHQRDHGEILEQQHRERGLAARGRQQVLLGERGEPDRGRGHREAHAGDHADDQGLLEKQRDYGHGGNGEHDLDCAQAEDRAPHRPHALRVELQAEQEQQQHDAEFGELQHRVRIRDQPQAPRPDRHTRDEVAEHRAQSEPLEQWNGDHACRQVDESLLEKTVGFHG